jgi:hypothetical protein
LSGAHSKLVISRMRPRPRSCHEPSTPCHQEHPTRKTLLPNAPSATPSAEASDAGRPFRGPNGLSRCPRHLCFGT